MKSVIKRVRAVSGEQYDRRGASAGMAFQPETLYKIARSCVNRSLERTTTCFSLEIPLILKRDLQRSFLRDNINYKGWKSTKTLRKVLNWYRFRNVFDRIPADIYLTIMNWNCSTSPEFVAEIMIVTYEWYEHIVDIPIPYLEYDPLRLKSPRMCYDCAIETEKPIEKYKMWNRIMGYKVMSTVFQNSRSWCSVCHTTTLFKIMEYPYEGARKRFIEEIYYESD